MKKSLAMTGGMLTHLREYCVEHITGLVLIIGSIYRCFPGHPDKARKPDISFIRWERIMPELSESGRICIHPSLVEEIVSPCDGICVVD
ncbi:MAG: Uma2 family endonuclease [Gemmatales bacterium]|nr:Uma2 family endonuclease [Gemmatales bacterium]MDW7994495.1 Uma2 family endonuclease [Gemmatales bacterium]